MTFKDWLVYACQHRGLDFRGLLPELRLGDGLNLSVQASEFHKCEPLERREDGEYECVEVYSHGEFVSELDEYLCDRFTYGYVPVEIMEKLVEKHGGIQLIEANDGISYTGATIRHWAKGNEPGAQYIRMKYYSDENKCDIDDNKRYYLIGARKQYGKIDYCLARDRA